MEKLQAAIEKARAQREAAQTKEAAAPRMAPEPAESRPANAEKPKAGTNAWTEIAALPVDEKRLRQKRVFLSADDPESGHYDRLRTKILQLCRTNGWTRVVITSPTKSCGKTTTCANLLASFARQSDRKVIALDLDMRRPELGQMLGMRNLQSFSSVLGEIASFEDSAARIGENVLVAANSGPHRNPAQLILSDGAKRVFDDIQSRYQPDIMFFDTPPLLSVDDTPALLKHVDCAMIVAGGEMSTVDQIDQCEKEIAEQTNVLGVVLNRCNYVDETSAYGYSY